MRRLFHCAALAAVLLAAAPFAAKAQQGTMPLPNGLYLGAEAGVIIPQSTSVHGSGVSGGTLVSARGDLNFDAGPAAGITFGGHVNPYVAIEANFEYASFDVTSLNGTFTTSAPASFSGTLGLKGEMTASSMRSGRRSAPAPGTASPPMSARASASRCSTNR